jgi:transcriptional regulator with GAF, ATPase, and Fis domain
MAAQPTAYLVIRQDDGFGEVFTLNAGQRYTLGRATTNRIVLRDDVCSREHAEVFYVDGRWCVRDLQSLNGTAINGEKLDSEWELTAEDEISLGNTRLLFLDDIGQLPGVSVPVQQEQLAIKKRLSHTRFLTPPPLTIGAREPVPPAPVSSRHSLNGDLSRLYRLALDMGTAPTFHEAVSLVLKGLLEATPADVAAILVPNASQQFEPVDHQARDPSAGYRGVSQYLTQEVTTSREAILAEDVSSHAELRERQSLRGAGVSSLICAPISHDDKVLGLIHLYCIDSKDLFDAEDLEFVLAVARQLGIAAIQLQKQAKLSAENQSLRHQLRVESEIVGDSPAIRAVEKKIGLVADTHATVLIRGESGTGKELVARAIHYSSTRREGPFVCLNCAALPEALLESELFGHEKGAFTGATEKKVGKFEAANLGTIFLDEIGELNPSSQAKLLRILEGHPFERLGGHTPIEVDVRVVAATNKPLEEAIAAGTFRRDLFFRLQVVELVVPPLRDRPGDIVILARHFLKRYVDETGRKTVGFTDDALQKMLEYAWPGNVRELRNVVERAVVLGTRAALDASDIWLSSLETPAAKDGKLNYGYQPRSLDAMEKEHIHKTLEYTAWNKSQAAAILNIERSTLDRKIKTYDLKR